MYKKYISSIKNPLVGEVRLLQSSSGARKKKDSFVVEGFREVALALNAGYLFSEIFICEGFEQGYSVFLESCKSRVTIVSREVYKRMAYRGSTEGVIVIASKKIHDFANLSLERVKKPLLLVAESIEKPGNIGAILRTANALGVDAVVISNPKTDIYNPNVVRSSLGTVFSTDIILSTNEDTMEFLQHHKIHTYAAFIDNTSQQCHLPDYTKPSAFVIGSEDIGLSDEWIDFADTKIIIPMQGTADSINASMSAGILIYEAKRQRCFK